MLLLTLALLINQVILSDLSYGSQLQQKFKEHCALLAIKGNWTLSFSKMATQFFSWLTQYIFQVFFKNHPKNCQENWLNFTFDASRLKKNEVYLTFTILYGTQDNNLSTYWSLNRKQMSSHHLTGSRTFYLVKRKLQVLK